MSSLPRPSLEQSFFAELGKLPDVCLHTTLDAAPSGATSLQDCLISGLHALAAAIAPGRICASAADAESNDDGNGEKHLRLV